MHENDISEVVIGTAIHIHSSLGPGLLESVYEQVMYYELIKAGFQTARQVAIPVYWDNIKLEAGFRADIIVENKVLIELKSVETILKVHPKIVLTYLRMTGLRLGLLINFGEPYLKDGIRRIVNGL